MSQKTKTIDAQTLKRQQIEKNNAFNRFMLFRYSLAIFFFANLYWLLILAYKTSFLILAPTLLLFLQILACSEQVRLYGNKVVRLKQTKLALQAQGIINLVLLVLLSFNFGRVVFPIFSDQWQARLFLIGLQILGLILIRINLHRITEIKEDRDTYYHRFQKIQQFY